MRTAIIFAALLIASSAQAGTVGLHVGSQHLPNKGQNNVNFGLYVRADDWLTGVYHNSHRETTAYAGRAFDLGANFEVVAGLAYGYQKHSVGGKTYGASRGAIAPMVGLTYAPQVQLLGLQPRFWLLPPTPKNSGVLHFSVEHTF